MPLFRKPNVEKLKARADIGGLIAALRDPNLKPEVKVEVARVIGELKAPGAPEALVVPLHETHRPDVWPYAVEALRQIGDDRAARALVQGLDDVNWEEAPAECGVALISMGKRAMPALLEAIEVGPQQLRMFAALIAAQLAVHWGLPLDPFISILETKDRGDREKVIRGAVAMGLSGDPRAPRQLLDAAALRGLQDVSTHIEARHHGTTGNVDHLPHLKKQLLDALGEGRRQIGEEDARITSLIESLGSRRRTLTEPKAAQELIERGEAAVPLLIENIRMSGYIPLILGKIGDPRALEPLMELAQSPAHFESDPDAYGGYACETAVFGLGLLGDQRALPLLREIAAETNVGEIHMAATQAIGRLERTEGAGPTELKGLTGLELERIAESESTSAETLEALADDPSGRVKALVAMNPSTPRETLRKLAHRPEQHANLLMNPTCPSDVLAEIVKLGRAPNARYQAERHRNWKG